MNPARAIARVFTRDARIIHYDEDDDDDGGGDDFLKAKVIAFPFREEAGRASRESRERAFKRPPSRHAGNSSHRESRRREPEANAFALKIRFVK